MTAEFESTGPDDRRPFAEPLVDDERGKKGRLFSLPSHPEVVVRRDKVNISSPESISATIESINKTKALFSDLASRDGMYVANAEYALGEGTYGGESYAIVETINGVNLEKMTSFDAVAQKEVDECFANYFRHVARILREGGAYWADMHPEQFVYGTRDGEEVSHAYVVDLDPFTQDWMNEEGRKQNPPKARAQALYVLEDLKAYLTSLRMVEAKLPEGEKLDSARNAFAEVLGQMAHTVAIANDNVLTGKFARLKEFASNEPKYKSIADIRNERQN